MKRKAIYLLYRALETALAPLGLLYFLLRGLRDRRYFATVGQRTGALPALWQKTAPGAVWLHAVSVGEVLAALPLLAELRRQLPRAPLYLSTTTLAGHETALKRAATLTDGIFYSPVDYVFAIRRVLRRLRPSVVVVLETEIWPNLYRETVRTGAALILVNGRISDRALPRYLRFRALFGPVLSLCHRILAQSQDMVQRFHQAGAPAHLLSAAGNLKYDFTLPDLPENSPIRAFLNASSAPLWIAASTCADSALAEEDHVIAAHRELSREGWRLVLAPRKPERFPEAADKLSASGLSFTRRTALTNPSASVLLLDSVGELAALFPFARTVFMGGTLSATGGHNILEPALAARPVIAGPHLENFRDIGEHFTTRRALFRIATGAELAHAIRSADDALGQRARSAALEQTGASRRAADAIVEAHTTHLPAFRPKQPAWAFQWLLASQWASASSRDRQSRSARARQLPVPVVSVGNITAGGTGKTPMCVALLKALAAHQPALLTRGHGRGAPGIAIAGPAEHISTALIGDEPQLIRRATQVPIAVGGDRFAAGTELLRSFNPGVLVLDDGFQHLQLSRNFDLVLIDSLNPFGGGHLLPLGRLREPLEGLARASAFVITRADEAINLAAIEHALRRYNPSVPIFHARTQARAWHHAGETLPSDAFTGKRSLAFCGLGNPNAFWHTLTGLNTHPLEKYAFGDHHRYRPSETIRLSRRARAIEAEVLLTTEKDAINIAHPVDHLYWLETETVVDRMEELISLISESWNKQYSSS